MKFTDLNGFALDLGGTKTAAAHIERGVVVERVQISTDGTVGMENQIKVMADLLEKIGHQNGMPLGVAVTGRVGQDGRWHSVNRGTLTQIDDVSLGEALRARFGSGYLCNDAAAAGFAEFQFGAGRETTNFAYITISTGVGGGLVLNGKLVKSTNGLAGHIGFTSTPISDDLCGSGRRRSVESVAGGRAISSAAAKAGQINKDARAVFEAAVQGEAWAMQIVDRSAHAIAILSADLIAILGLDKIALGGSIGLSDGYVQKVLQHLACEPELFQVPLSVAELGQNSPLIGALSLQHMRDEQ